MTVYGGSRQILVHGLVFVLVGLIWGLAVPGTPHPRLALGAHVQFVTNGMLFIVMATALLTLPHAVGVGAVRIMLAAVWLTWAMALSEVANSWWGAARTLPIAAHQAGATGGEPWQELVVTLAHMAAAVGLLVAWALLVIGFVKQSATSSPRD